MILKNDLDSSHCTLNSRWIKDLEVKIQLNQSKATKIMKVTEENRLISTVGYEAGDVDIAHLPKSTLNTTNW